MKKYKSEDGSYLDLDEKDGQWRVAWYFPDEDDFGAYVGDRDFSGSVGGTDEDKKTRWEVMTADAAAKPFSCGKSAYGYEFETEKQAKLALIAANTSLNNGGSPLPDWLSRLRRGGYHRKGGSRNGSEHE